MAVLVRPLDRRPDDRRRRPERGRGDRLRAQGQGPRGELRLAPVRGQRAASRRARARPGAIKPVITAEALRRQLLDHRRRRHPRPGAAGLARALRVRRLLPRRAPDRGALGGRATSLTDRKLTVPQLSSFGEDARGRVYATSLDGPGLPLRPVTDHSRPRAQPEPADADRDEHVGRGARPGVGGRSGAGDRRRTSTRSRRRSPRAAERAGSRSRTTTPTTPRPTGAARAARRRAAGLVRHACATATASAPFDVLHIPGHADDHLVFVAGRGGVHGRRRAGPGQRVRLRAAARVPRRPAAAARAGAGRDLPRARRRGDRSGGEARRVPRPPRRARAQAAGGAGGGRATEDELLDAAWADAPAAVRQFAAIIAARAPREAARGRCSAPG